VFALVALVVALTVGLLLGGRIRTYRPRRIRTPFTKFIFDDQGDHYWDGRTWRPIVSRYGRAIPRRSGVPQVDLPRVAWSTSARADQSV
jgi:hypothetical protein